MQNNRATLISACSLKRPLFFKKAPFSIRVRPSLTLASISTRWKGCFSDSLLETPWG